MQYCSVFVEMIAKIILIDLRASTAGDGHVTKRVERILETKKCYLAMWRGFKPFISLSAFDVVMFIIVTYPTSFLFLKQIETEYSINKD